MLPLANTPLIEYTFEFLANAGVEDVFLYGGAHSDQLEKYIKYVLREREDVLPIMGYGMVKLTSTQARQSGEPPRRHSSN